MNDHGRHSETEPGDTESGDTGPAERRPDLARKGRGAVSNRAGRYEPAERPLEYDGWERSAAEDDLPPLRTTVTLDSTRTIISRNESPDVGFAQSVNPYRGCEHGCVYCFARPTHAWLGLSPGLDFESRLFAKPDAPELLAQELRKPGYKPEVIGLGTNTDPYQPIEREYRITRRVIETLAAFRHPLCIVTKSALVTRDIDLLAPLAEKRLAKVFLSITTLDRDLARSLEPRAATPARRLQTMRALAAAGIPVGVLAAPMIPALNDAELERILEAAAGAGATSAGYVLLRLPLEIKDLFREWLEAHAPAKARHVLSLLRDMRGGGLYQAEFGHRMTGSGPYAELLRQRFRLARRRLGLEDRTRDFDLDLFRPPPRAGDQLTLW